jgi:hypothetical protein
MPAIIEFPTLVQHAVEQFGTLFANVPERRHFAEYLTGWCSSANTLRMNRLEFDR